MANPMRAEPIIRRGLPSDAENLAALATQVFLHTYATDGISSPISSYVLSEFSVAKFLDLLNDTATNSVVIAEVNANLVGYALVNERSPCSDRTNCTAELATLYVQEHFTGKGVGSALIAYVEALAIERTGNPLWLTVNAKNKRAIAFYAMHGYSNIGVAEFRLGSERHENFVLVAKNA